MKRMIAAVLAIALAVGLLTGCGSGGMKKLKLEPFDIPWGATQQEAEELLACVYTTNAKEPNTVYVLGGDNDLQAFGTTPSMIVYTFNLVNADSDTPRLGAVTVYFPTEDYDSVLTALDKKCGERYYEQTQWGAENTDVYLFEDGIISIMYSSSPITDPNKLPAENRDRVIALSGMLYASQESIAKSYRDTFALLGMYSTAETDFVKVDNTK